jgi:hypothetical protein
MQGEAYDSSVKRGAFVFAVAALAGACGGDDGSTNVDASTTLGSVVASSTASVPNAVTGMSIDDASERYSELVEPGNRQLAVLSGLARREDRPLSDAREASAAMARADEQLALALRAEPWPDAVEGEIDALADALESHIDALHQAADAEDWAAFLVGYEKFTDAPTGDAADRARAALLLEPRAPLR